MREFQELVRRECGIELTDQEAWDRATVLIDLYRMFLGPIPEDPEAGRLAGSSNVIPLLRSPGVPYAE